MKRNMGAGIAGLLFALGLGISGMTDPRKVLGFLDVSGNWDPTLLFVMVGSIGVHFFTYRMIRRLPSPLFSPHWHLPTGTGITANLAMGSVTFGLGWAMAGYCPGPAVVSLASFQTRPMLFVAGMAAGMFLYKIQKNGRRKAAGQ